ncbi:hypothetical protein [Maritimibacter sp. UBA3975]|uniref:hypothetical protein n=1 Tax=Maritimibacter sp. UBA3975 TaxID=1946833 RepID=UPI000C0A6ACD|nr:hypothetical protein [Maritimibacter sp. UBA3975]MAM63684.1 hypothetical protein [Maritimibacter sp.]|tara:strand:+ start:6863 stop:7255 length:393 start_codon:yes stop_codon:yes gene_type:complete
MTASKLSISLAVLMVIIGMGWGIAMAISGNHETAPAHAHLNLLGWVSLFLMGLYYRWHPERDQSGLAKLQVAVWAAATAAMVAGIALIYSGAPQAEPLAAISSLVLFADMLLFGWIVLGASRQPVAHPAE